MTSVHFWHFLVLLVFWPFSECLACFGQYGHTEWHWQWFTERSMQHYKLRSHILQKGWAGMPSFGKKSSDPRFQGKWRHWKLWKKLSGLITSFLHLTFQVLEYGGWIWRWTIFFFHWDVVQMKTKQVTVYGNVTIICVYLSTHWKKKALYDLLCNI